MEHAQLIESAFVNYLVPLVNNIGASVWTPGPNIPAGLLILPGENNSDKAVARIVAYVEGDLGEEDPPCSGNRWADVIVELRTPVSVLTPEEVAALTPEPLSIHQANADALQIAILDAGLPDYLTAAQAGFTCFGLTDRMPQRKQDPNYWSSGWKIRIYSCPQSFAN